MTQQTEQTEQRIPLPERTARRLSDLLTAALAGQAVAQAATAAAQGLAERYQDALALATGDYGEALGARFDRDTGELVLPAAPQAPPAETHRPHEASRRAIELVDAAIEAGASQKGA